MYKENIATYEIELKILLGKTFMLNIITNMYQLK